MASPAFIYAFDNLGPQRFVELCGLLFGARFRGFLLSSPGADGGVDAEVSPPLGEFRSERTSFVIDTFIPPNKLTVFQFKHKVVGRVGEANARTQILSGYKSTDRKKSEVLGQGIIERNPDTYVLVTNVEVNSIFRKSFIDLCKEENPGITNYQVIGLDELESWVINERHLRAEYFPTLFDHPCFNLKLKLQSGVQYESVSARQYEKGVTVKAIDGLLCLAVMNVGSRTSYLESIKFKVLVDGELKYCVKPVHPHVSDPLGNPKIGDPIEPGKNQSFNFQFEFFRNMKIQYGASNFFLVEILVFDQIDNVYTIEILDEIQEGIFN
jgi:hypothetical protein